MEMDLVRWFASNNIVRWQYINKSIQILDEVLLLKR